MRLTPAEASELASHAVKKTQNGTRLMYSAFERDSSNKLALVVNQVELLNFNENGFLIFFEKERDLIQLDLRF